jgi:eukaryotic-like serine/threonine-protein kinase
MPSLSSTTDLPTSIDVDLESGHTVGEYTIDGRLGQGAFGTVYKAVHPLIGKVVAIKVLARRYSVDPEMVSRFMAEARAVNQIRHRNIIDIFSFGTLDDGRQYYVMEYLDGEPLDALIDRKGTLALADALPILRGIAKALDAAHAKGVAHRDLKAENVFLATDPDGGVFPKLLDFGIAKLLAPEDGVKHKTRTGLSVGTPYYMSPEQCRGKDVDHRTDIYAFGVLAYRMLTGVYPFDADDHISIMMQQINADAKPPSSHVEELPSVADDVVLWLLAKEPTARPADCRTAVRALEGPNANATETHPPHVSVPRRTSVSGPALTTVGSLPPKSRAPLFAGIGATVAVAGLALFFAFGARDDAKPAAPPPAAEPPAPIVQPTPPPSRAAPPAEKPELPKTVIVTVTGVPDGTEVLIGSDVIGAAPGPVQLGRSESPIVLTFRAEGYMPASTTVIPDGAKLIELSLKKKPRRGGPTKPTRDDIIDVFGSKKK